MFWLYHSFILFFFFKKPTSELMSAIQLGIGQSIGGLSPKPKRDVLYGDFDVVESIFFPRFLQI